VQEQQLKDKFRQFWMSAIADGFKDDLEEIRKVCVAMIYLWELSNAQFSFQEPNLGSSRLALLIDSLAAGAEVFSSNDDTTINEMDVVLN
jgi:ribosome assembly protein 3